LEEQALESFGGKPAEPDQKRTHNVDSAYTTSTKRRILAHSVRYHFKPEDLSSHSKPDHYDGKSTTIPSVETVFSMATIAGPIHGEIICTRTAPTTASTAYGHHCWGFWRRAPASLRVITTDPRTLYTGMWNETDTLILWMQSGTTWYMFDAATELMLTLKTYQQALRCR